MKRFVAAPQSFKGSLTALEAAQAIATGVRRTVPDAEVDLIPMADGGEGTVEALVESTGGSYRLSEATGPLGAPVQARWGILGDGETAVIEMAAASGLTLLTQTQLDPLAATTYGTGQLIRAALDIGCRQFIIGIGGSATNDGGAGMAQALGVRFSDAQGRELPPGGAALQNLAHIDVSGLDPRVKNSHFRVACDVNNPLIGPTGAAAVYGPQKGATPKMVAQLDAAMAQYAAVIERDLGPKVAQMHGVGAAGGLGAGLVAFLNASLEPGVEIVLEANHFAQRCAGADVVFTGEGRLDGQTAYGKAVAGVAKMAQRRNVPVVALAGGITPDGYDLLKHGIEALLSITPGPMTLEEANSRAAELIANAAEQATRLICIRDKFRR